VLGDESVLRVKAVLFDLDGTIFEITERDAFARYQALNDLGYSVSLDDVRKRYRYGIGSMGILKELGIRLSEKQEKDYIEKSFAHFTNRENARSLTKIHNGAFDVLSTLSKKYKLGLVTSRDNLSSTEEELDWFGIREHFTLIVTREVAARHYRVGKIPLLPFEEQRTKLYRCAIALLKLNPDEMLCVGDAVSEIEPAKKLGINVIGVLTGFSSKEDMQKASISTIKSLGELVSFLN
jgi:phosphoglycolate phosphatase-like HAD superfamily hydrolase